MKVQDRRNDELGRLVTPEMLLLLHWDTLLSREISESIDEAPIEVSFAIHRPIVFIEEETDGSSEKRHKPVMNIGLLHIIFFARHPAFHVNVRHFLSCDRCLLQDNVARVPNDAPKNVSKREYIRTWTHRLFSRAMRHANGEIFAYGFGFLGVMLKLGPGWPCDLEKISTNSSRRPCSTDGCKELNSGRVSTCSGQRSSLWRIYNANRSSPSPAWMVRCFSCSRCSQRHLTNPEVKRWISPKSSKRKMASPIRMEWSSNSSGSDKWFRLQTS